MSPAQNQVHGLASAFFNTIAKMTPKEKERQPSGHYGENFNALLDAAKRAAPGVDAALWPKPLEVHEGGFGGTPFTEARFSEVETYSRQVAALLFHAG